MQLFILILSGPACTKVLEECGLLAGHIGSIGRLPFMHSMSVAIFGIELLITRCGYTGEDGFEISIPCAEALRFAEELGRSHRMKLAGLAARDILRLEAGLCLYGADIDENTSPVEASLKWTISKSRLLSDTRPFNGRESILRQIRDGVHKRRVGFTSLEGPPPRSGTMVLNSVGDQVATITSGGYSPTLERNIAMGYKILKNNKNEMHQNSSHLSALIRNKKHALQETKLPFITPRYCKL